MVKLLIPWYQKIFRVNQNSQIKIHICSEIPKDENWNFIEINSTSDLLAMENPQQKKYKTHVQKTRLKSQKHQEFKNNWSLFKHKFPKFTEKKDSLKVSRNNSSKKDKRDISPQSYSKDKQQNKQSVPNTRLLGIYTFIKFQSR